MPLVTVVIPVYNGAGYIEQAVKSVITQSYINWELILVDDGSGDNSLEILDAFSQADNRIVVISQKNTGQASARNRGVQAATGKYLAFLDQDDYYAKKHLEFLVNFLENNEDIGMAYNDAEIVDKDGNRLYNQGTSPFPPKDSPPKSIFECLKKDLCILPGTVMMRRELFIEVGGFDGDFVGFEDDHLFIRIFRKAKFGRTYEVGLFYRMHGTNTSLNVEVMCKSRVLFYEKIKIMLPDDLRRGMNFSRIVASRLALAMLYDLYRVRSLSNSKSIRALYDSYKALSNKAWKYWLATPLVHPFCPVFFIRCAVFFAKRFRIFQD